MILISIAIALGVVLLVVLIGILVAITRRRDDEHHEALLRDQRGLSNHPTAQLANFGAATAVLLDSKSEKPLPYPESEGTPVTFDGGANYENPDIDSKSRARYSFVAEHPGELNVSAGEDLVILEASDANW